MNNLLEINRVHVEIKSNNKGIVCPLQGVDLKVGLKEKVGLVGESGCGKSMILRTILRMLPHGGYQTKGTISLNGNRIDKKDDRYFETIRGKSKKIKRRKGFF